MRALKRRQTRAGMLHTSSFSFDPPGRFEAGREAAGRSVDYHLAPQTARLDGLARRAGHQGDTCQPAYAAIDPECADHFGLPPFHMAMLPLACRRDQCPDDARRVPEQITKKQGIDTDSPLPCRLIPCGRLSALG